MGHRVCVLSDIEVFRWLGNNRRRIRGRVVNSRASKCLFQIIIDD